MKLSLLLLTTPASLKQSVQRLRWTTHNALLRYPIYLSLARQKRPDKVVGPRTELVIEGFPRSGNTFAVTAFEVAQGRDVGVASHLHASAQVRAATKGGIPTLVLIRDPLDAVTSHLIFSAGTLTVRQAYRYYIRFYSSVAADRDRVVVATFDEVTTDFGRVIDRVNDRFGTAFSRFDHTRENVARCFELIEDEMMGRRGHINEDSIPRPSSHRRELKQAVRTQVTDEKVADLRAEAERLYALLREADAPAAA